MVTKNGGSGGARPRPKANKIKGVIATPSPIASQIIAGLQAVFSAWPKLSCPLKAAILAIIGTVDTSPEVKP